MLFFVHAILNIYKSLFLVDPNFMIHRGYECIVSYQFSQVTQALKLWFPFYLSRRPPLTLSLDCCEKMIQLNNLTIVECRGWTNELLIFIRKPYQVSPNDQFLNYKHYILGSKPNFHTSLLLPTYLVIY